jgi:hypothetical protein
MIARFLVAAIGALCASALPSLAQDSPPKPSPCEAPDHFRYLTDDLPFMREATRRTNALNVVVVGSASTLGVGPGTAYPAKFGEVLAKSMPGIAVSVTVKAKPGQTAADMIKVLKTEVLPAKPSLVIWQTGTVDANRGVNPEAFADTLLAGIELVHGASSDVILIDMQFSPYTSSMINLEVYRKLMIWVAQRRDVFLFRRYELMHHWSENQIFDLGVTDRTEQRRVAERIHGCIGEILAEAVLSDRYVAREQPK